MVAAQYFYEKIYAQDFYLQDLCTKFMKSLKITKYQTFRYEFL